MYGTVARLRVRAGQENNLVEHLRTYEIGQAPGFVASALYRADSGGGELWLAAIFESKEAYGRNADSPEQDARYREFRSFLEEDPEWHDGEVLGRVVASA